MSALRPLWISEVFPPPVLGGSEMVVYQQVCRAFPHTTHVVGPHTDGCDAFDADAPYTATRVRGFERTWRLRDLAIARQNARVGRHAVQAARTFRPDVLVAGQGYPTPFVVDRLARALRRPWVAMVYGEELYSQRVSSGLLSPARRAIFARVLRRADGIVTCSRWTRDEVLRWGVAADRAHVVLPGVDGAEIHPRVETRALRERLGLTGQLVLLSCGRVHVKKGQITVARLLPRIAEHVPNVAFVMVGDGDVADVMRVAEQGDCADRVVSVPSLPRADLPMYYAASDVVVMAYRQYGFRDTEGFGIVLAEAGAAGKPAVATLMGGTGDAIVDGVTGYLVPDRDDDVLVDRLVTLLRDPALCTRLGDAGRARVETELNWRHASERFRTILTALCARAASVTAPTTARR